MDTSGFGSWSHLAGRFAGSLVPVGPSRKDARWASGHLLPGERTLWSRMSPQDRRHAVGVARRALALLDGAVVEEGNVDRAFVAAALLHDVGKVESHFGTWARSGVTVLAMAVGRDRLSARRGRIAAYLCHDRIGADLLLAAGSDPLTVAWAAEHHRPPERWSVDARLGEALKAADDD